MKLCPRQALNCASNATSIRHEEAATNEEAHQGCAGRSIEPDAGHLKWKYKDVNCVDK